MKKYNLILLLTWMFAVSAFGQTQQLSRWTLGSANSNFNMNKLNPVLTGGKPGNSVGVIQNSIHDSKGRVLFYVGQHKIYDCFGNQIDELTCIPSSLNCHVNDLNTEYPIVPCIEDDNGCSKRYYVFYSLIDNNIQRIKLYAKLVTIDNNNGKITSKDIVDGSGQRRLLATSEVTTGGSANEWRNSGIAVSPLKELQNNEVTINVRYLYWIAGDVKKINLTKIDNDVNNGIGGASKIFGVNNNPTFKFNPLEADLSHDGTQLLWGTSTENIYSHSFFYLRLNPANGNWNGTTNEVFRIGTSDQNTNPMRGVEFAPSGEEIFVSTGGLNVGHGIYHKSLQPISSPFIPISGSKDYGASQLELAQNGLIYAVAPGYMNLGYAGINPTSFVFPLGIINANITYTGLSSGGYYCLPDQIDGENYDNTLMDFYDVGDYSFPGIVNGGPIIISNSNPWPFLNHLGNRIKVAGTLTFINPTIPNHPPPTRSSWNLVDLDFSMAKGSKIVIGDNMDVTLTSCSFQSADCAEMWKGIEVIGTGRLFINSSGGIADKKSEYYDAEIAISVLGPVAKAKITNSIFNRNETHIKIVDYLNYSSDGADILRNKFLHTEPLRIFSSGQQFPTNGSGIYGTTSISLLKTIIVDGTPIILHIANNEFIGGLYGITSVGESFKIIEVLSVDYTLAGCRFSNMKTAAIKVNQKDISANINVQNSTFEDVNQALYAIGRNSTIFSKNIVLRTLGHAVEIYGARYDNITITENSFINFNRSAILLNSNAANHKKATPRSNILINNNTFEIVTKPLPQNLDKPTAITIMDASLDTTQYNYNSIRVTNNTMTNVAYGIKTFNLNGSQLMNKDYKNNYITVPPRTDINDFDNNKITVYASYTTPVPAISDYNTGIQLNNSRGLVTAVNKIESNQFTQWRSSGIYSDNTRQTLFYKNTITAGRGIGAYLYGMGNDIKCNTFAMGVNGISLQDYKMRLVGQTHGQPLLESRDNNYVKTSKENIELYLYRVPSTPAILKNHIDANQWLMNTSPSVLIEPTPTCSPFVNCIRRFGAPDKCGFIADDHGGDGTKIIYDVPPALPSGDNLYDWQSKYEYERQQKSEGLVYNQLLSKLIDVEHFIAVGSNAEALLLLNSMQSENVYEANCIQLYTILVVARLEDERSLNETELEIYKVIAAQDTYTAGPAIYLARAILWQQEGLNYVDMVDRHSGNIGIKLNGEQCIGNFQPDFSIRLMNEEGYIYSADEVPINLDEDGNAFISGEIIATLPQDYTYTFVIGNGNYPSPPFQTLGDWMDNDNNTIDLCNNGVLGKTNQNNTNSILTPVQESGVNSVSIFPNPAKDVLTIVLPQVGEFNITIFDIMGKAVYQQFHTQKAVLLTGNYKTGVYLVKVVDIKGNTVSRKKVMIHQ